MIVQCAKCRVHYENGMPPIALSAAGHSCVFEPVVVSAPPNNASGSVVSHRCDEDGLDVWTIATKDGSFEVCRYRPTDASGGVTDEHPFDAIDDCITEFANMGCKGYANDLHVARTKLARRIRELEAADRARKPGYRQVTLADIRHLADDFGLTAPTLLASLQHIGAVIPDAGRGEK